jgi:hypothetical protein
VNDERVGIAILERQLEENFKHLTKVFKNKKIILDLENYYHKNFFTLFLKRRDTSKKLISLIALNKRMIMSLDKIIISNSEGFIAKNLIHFIKKINPDIIIISLQHGKFFLVSSFKTKIRNFLNFITMKTSGFYLFGSGFFEQNVNEFIVSNSRYKKTLIENCNVAPEKVFVAASFLKSRASVNMFRCVENGASVVIFLMQPLAKTGYCTEQTENEILDSLMQYLSERHNDFLIKQHPFYESDYLNKKFGQHIYSGTLKEIAPSIKFVYSFFSEGLKELEHKDRVCLAIKHNSINVRESVYAEFSNVLDLEDRECRPNLTVNLSQENYLEDFDLDVVIKRFQVDEIF